MRAPPSPLPTKAWDPFSGFPIDPVHLPPAAGRGTAQPGPDLHPLLPFSPNFLPFSPTLLNSEGFQPPISSEKSPQRAEHRGAELPPPQAAAGHRGGAVPKTLLRGAGTKVARLTPWQGPSKTRCSCSKACVWSRALRQTCKTLPISQKEGEKPHPTPPAVPAGRCPAPSLPRFFLFPFIPFCWGLSVTF